MCCTSSAGSAGCSSRPLPSPPALEGSELARVELELELLELELELLEDELKLLGLELGLVDRLLEPPWCKLGLLELGLSPSCNRLFKSK